MEEYPSLPSYLNGYNSATSTSYIDFFYRDKKIKKIKCERRRGKRMRIEGGESYSLRNKPDNHTKTTYSISRLNFGKKKFLWLDLCWASLWYITWHTYDCKKSRSSCFWILLHFTLCLSISAFQISNHFLGSLLLKCFQGNTLLVSHFYESMC